MLIGSLSLPLVKANPFSTLAVWPVGSVDTGEPIVTESPADLMVYNIDPTHIPIDPSWLLLATNEATYDHIISVTTSTGVTYTKGDFLNVFNVDPTGKSQIPPLSPDGNVPSMPGTTWIDLLPGYPGCESSDQYEVGSVKSKLVIPSSDELWWAIKDSNLAPITDVPQIFTITVTVDASATDLKILVMILGFWNGENPTFANDGSNPFNVHSPYTRSTILVAPEAAAIALAVAPLSAYGLYRVKHKLRKN